MCPSLCGFTADERRQSCLPRTCALSAVVLQGMRLSEVVGSVVGPLARALAIPGSYGHPEFRLRLIQVGTISREVKPQSSAGDISTGRDSNSTW